MRPSRSLAFFGFALLAATTIVGVAACSGLKVAPVGADASTPIDASFADVGGGEDAPVDAPIGPVRPLDDTACIGANKWSATSKTDAKCTGRVVKLLESWKGGDGANGSTSISIVRAVNGRTGVAVHRIQSPEEGEMRVFAMNATPEGFGVPPPFRVSGTQFESVGVGVRLAVGTGDDFHVVYQTVEDAAGGPVFYRRLLATGTFTAEENVNTIGGKAQVGLAVSPKNDDAVVSYFIKPKTVASRLRTSSGFKPEVNVADNLSGTVPGAGMNVPLFDTSGQAHIAYVFSNGAVSSSPRYIQSDGQFWTIASQTVDNATGSGIFGLSLGFSIFGTTKHVAYFARPPSLAFAELRVGSWAGSGNFPTVETVLQGIPIEDATNTPVHLSLAVDRRGAMHMVASIPEGDPVAKCKIAYLRQVPAPADSLKWIQDTVDEGPCVNPDDVQVSIVVDDAIRAHMAYAFAGVGVFYATRYDRQ